MSAGGFNNTTGADAADDEQQPTMPAARPSEPQLRFGLQFQFGAVALLEALCLLFSISTITSTCTCLVRSVCDGQLQLGVWSIRTKT